jgi:hypothetical protein
MVAYVHLVYAGKLYGSRFLPIQTRAGTHAGRPTLLTLSAQRSHARIRGWTSADRQNGKPHMALCPAKSSADAKAPEA